MSDMKNTRTVADVAVAIERSKMGGDLHERFMGLLQALDSDRGALIRQAQSLQDQLNNLKTNGVVARATPAASERLIKRLSTRTQAVLRPDAENGELTRAAQRGHHDRDAPVGVALGRPRRVEPHRDHSHRGGQAAEARGPRVRMPRLRRYEVPEAERERALWLLESHWMLPNGEEIATRRILNRAREQLLEGCYYAFEWPADVTKEEVREWIDFVGQVLEWHKGAYL